MEFKVKTNLWSSIIIGVFGAVMLLVTPGQVRLPMFDSGAPNPRIVPGICLAGTLICPVILLIESLAFRKEEEIESDWAEEKPCIFPIVLLCALVALIINIGFIPGVVTIFPIMSWYCGEQKPFIYIYTLAAGIGIFFLFKYVFHISLPRIPGFGG